MPYPLHFISRDPTKRRTTSGPPTTRAAEPRANRQISGVTRRWVQPLLPVPFPPPHHASPPPRPTPISDHALPFLVVGHEGRDFTGCGKAPPSCHSEPIRCHAKPFPCHSEPFAWHSDPALRDKNLRSFVRINSARNLALTIFKEMRVPSSPAAPQDDILKRFFRSP